MYQLLENIFAHTGDQETRFKKGFRASLDALRKKHEKPIALLAVTEDKYQAMRESEFGKRREEKLTDGEVKELSGFDAFFGPEQFEQYLAENGGDSNYLLYARTSEPVAKLKNPSITVRTPLLETPHTRRIIKANAITLNIDDPSWSADNPRRINDTKEYLDAMHMAFSVGNVSDLTTPEFITFLRSQGVDTATEVGKTILRAKPMKGAYGCYGHLTGSVDSPKFRDELEEQIAQRGAYVIQPEMTTITIRNETDGQEYAFIDRNFMSCTNGTPQFLGGFRSLLPVESLEVKQGRIHGNNATVWAEIAEKE